MEGIRSNSFFKFDLQNLLQLVLMCALLLNWWGNRAGNYAAEAVILQQHGDRIVALEQASKQTSIALNDVQRKIDVLIAIAEEQRKKQK